MHLANSNDGGAGCAPPPAGMVSGPSSLLADGTTTGEQCRFPKLEECAHFHYERVQLPSVTVCIQANMERSLHSQHSQEDDCEWYMVQVTSGDECWLLQRNFENFRLLDSQLHQCIYDRKISQLPDLDIHQHGNSSAEDVESLLVKYLRRFTAIADNSVNCGPVLNWLQMDNKGHRLLVPSEESRSINTPAVAAAYSVRRYVSQARDELNLEVGDMISVIDMASPGESIWWRGKRGFQVGFFPQHCVHIIGDKVPRNMPLPAPVVGSLALSPIKPVLRKHGKLIAFFRSFILNRPSRRRLKQSGILRERVFGCDLGEHLLNSGCDIPTVLKCCSEFIETHGIVDGIYRLSGVTSNIQKLRNAFDEDRIPNLYTEDILQDIHSVASLLKMYFRELPNPLCTYQLYQSFVQAVQGCTTSARSAQHDHERLLKMREAVQKLPPPHYRTLEYLARHLAKVAKHGDRTGMTVRNVAIVWAPNLLRCAELEVGGVAALQGVGVQAVVTEFLICYADLIFCDNLNAKLNVSDLDAVMQQAALLNATSPKRSRPKSLAISTPTKLITLEEARSKHHKDAYIEVGGGPDSLPKKYHTIIELPLRKRVNSKRSPLGWRSLFGKSRNSRTAKPTIVHHVVNTELDSPANCVKPEVKIVLRTVKSAESLSDLDQLPPLQNILCTKPAGHNRSVSHDSYFDTLQSSQEGSLLDLSEIQVNFDLEESEMRIFSEDESLVSSPRVQPRRIRISSGNNSGNPSPKKQPRVILSPESASRKRTRLEEQLSDIQFIDCNTPEMICGSTIVQVHQVEGPRNKSPRNSQCLDLSRNSQCLDLRRNSQGMDSDFDLSRNSQCFDLSRKSPGLDRSRNSPGLELNRKSPGLDLCRNSQCFDLPRDYKRESKSSSERDRLSQVMMTSTSTINAGTPQSPTPQSPTYKLLESSTGTTPGDMSPTYLSCKPVTAPKSPKSSSYENVLTTISITYKSPTKTKSFLTDERVIGLLRESPNYEAVTVKAEDAQIPTSTANLPLQEAKTLIEDDLMVASKSSSDLDLDFRNSTVSITNSLSTINDINEELHREVDVDAHLLSESKRRLLSESLISESNEPTTSLNINEDEDSFPKCDTTLSELIDSYDRIARATSGDWSHVESEDLIGEEDTEDQTDAQVQLQHDYENVKTSSDSSEDTSNDQCLVNYENINFTSNGDIRSSSNGEGENVKELLALPEQDLIEFSPVVEALPQIADVQSHNHEKRKQSPHGSDDQDQDVYQQVKYFRRSVHEINELVSGSSQDDNIGGLSSGENIVEPEGGGMDHKNPMMIQEEHLDLLYENVDNNVNIEEDVAKVIEIIEPVENTNTCTEHKEVKLEEVQINLSLSPLNGDGNPHDPEVTYDSLETNDYETIEFTNDSLEASITDGSETRESDNPVAEDEVLNVLVKTNVVELDTSQLNDIDIAMTTRNDHVTMTVTMTTDVDPTITSSRGQSSSISPKVKQLTSKFEMQEESFTGAAGGGRSLPPCVRARNLKSSKKTARSLDETEFLKKTQGENVSSSTETDGHGSDDGSPFRRKSLDENMCGYKMNTLPKTLNKPKKLPDDPDMQLHVVPHDVNLNRERIEKYKEERRKFLHDKYRSESFKENKDVLLSRFKVFKPLKDETAVEVSPGKVQSISPAHSLPVNASPPSLPPINSSTPSISPSFPSNKSATNVENASLSKVGNLAQNGVKARTALFEPEIPEVEFRTGNVSSRRHKIATMPPPGGNSDSREGRERDGSCESPFEQARRTFDSTALRKDRTSTSYCIKDMKAIFESKSQQ